MSFNPSTVPPGRFFILLAVITGVAVTLGSIGWPGHDKPRQVVKDSKERKGAPDFELKDSSGKVVHLSDYKGKVVLLDFWALQCGACVTELTNIEALYSRRKADGLLVLGIGSRRHPIEEVRDFFARRKEPPITYPVARDARGAGGKTTAAYGVGLYPCYAVIDRQGLLVYLGRDWATASAKATALLDAKER